MNQPDHEENNTHYSTLTQSVFVDQYLSVNLLTTVLVYLRFVCFGMSMCERKQKIDAKKRKSILTSLLYERIVEVKKIIVSQNRYAGLGLTVLYSTVPTRPCRAYEVLRCMLEDLNEKAILGFPGTLGRRNRYNG